MRDYGPFKLSSEQLAGYIPGILPTSLRPRFGDGTHVQTLRGAQGGRSFLRYPFEPDLAVRVRYIDH